MASLPHRTRVLELLGQADRPLHLRDIAGRLGIGAPLMNGLTAMLDDLVMNGEALAFSGDQFRIAKGTSVVETKHGARPTRQREGALNMNPRGFGFVSSPGTGEADVFIAPESLGGALHGDLVVVRVGRVSPKGPEGEIVRVTKRAAHRVPGTLRRRGKSQWLEPDDARLRGPITLAGEGATAGNDGDAVVVELARYPMSPDDLPEGKLLVVLGRPGDPEVEVKKVLAREDIVEGFPAAVLDEARAYGDRLIAEQIEGREDLRPIALTTIDPIDARDHDDAVYVRRATEKDPDGAAYVAWIAIADVSAYVRPGTALDAEAQKRGCSVYLPDRAIPMLPRELSSHLCSLVAHEDRLCLAVEVALDATATPIKHRFVEGVMRNRAKLAYEDVGRALGWVTDVPPSAAAIELLADLQIAAELSGLLRARRMRRGALDFDLPEAKVKLDEQGTATDVVRARADPGVKKAYNLIEELMLLGNEVVATELAERTVPTVYRVHGTPDEQKLDRFASLVDSLGFTFKLDDAKDPKALGKFLKQIATHPRAQVINSLLLRAMRQATYDVINIGHFGLASKAYLHFTSPIRRYPDLVVHRAMHRLCQGQKIETGEEAMAALKAAALAASVAERKAMDVEREVVDLHRALLMRSRIGEELEGTVTGLVGSGLYVALDAPYVDVLVKFDMLGRDVYELDAQGLTAIGQRSGDVIHLGDRMRVKIEDVSITRRQVLGRRVLGEGERAEDSTVVRRSEGRNGRGAPARSGGRRDPHGKKAASARTKKDEKRKTKVAKRDGRAGGGGTGKSSKGKRGRR